MVSFGARRALESSAAPIAALVLAAFTTTAVAQFNADDGPLLNQIQEIISRDGPYSIDLLEPLTQLGLLYQESDDEILALATLERAVHIVRVNKGLHTLEQVPLTRQLIRIEEARGNRQGAWERQQDLLALLRRHPDDLRTVPALKEIADKQMAVLEDVIAGHRPPEVVLGCSTSSGRRPRTAVARPAARAPSCKACSRRRSGTTSMRSR